MIKIQIEIMLAPHVRDPHTNEFGVGVKVTGQVDPKKVPAQEGATLVGIGMAINEYMRSRGATEFNCLKGLINNV